MRRTAAICLLGCFLMFAGCSSESSGNASDESNSHEGSSAVTSTTPSVVSTIVSSVETTPDSVDDSVVVQTQTKTGAVVVLEQGGGVLAGKKVGVIVNSASTIEDRHLVDALLDLPTVEVEAIFAPEHGWRGNAAAGETVADEVDDASGLPVYSLYGTSRQPDSGVLESIDVLVFDLQDVGARYYTYISTLGLAMQAAAKTDTAFVVLDRPNPRGGVHVSGPVRRDDQASFVGQYPIPSLYGLTAGELALAIKDERWLNGLESLDLTVVEMEGWKRSALWPDTGLMWQPPSPGLPTFATAVTYPALVQFEATTLSYGRGTNKPFGQVGAPWLDGDALAADLNERGLPGVEFDAVSFVPQADARAADPQYEGSEVFGVVLRVTDPSLFEPTIAGVHMLEAVGLQTPDGLASIIDRSQMFDLLAGDAQVRDQLVTGVPASVIVESWNEDLAEFEELRSSYLIYRD